MELYPLSKLTLKSTIYFFLNPYPIWQKAFPAGVLDVPSATPEPGQWPGSNEPWYSVQ